MMMVTNGECSHGKFERDIIQLIFEQPLRVGERIKKHFRIMNTPPAFLLVTPFYGVTRPVALYALMAWKEEMDSTVLRILPLVVFQP